MKKADKTWIKRIVWGLIGLVVVLGLIYVWLPSPLPVDVGVAERGALTVTVDEDGRTRVRERFTITAPMTGNLERIELRAGQVVEAGDELAHITPTRAPLLDPRSRAQGEAQVATARAALAQARTALEQASQAHEFARSEAQRLEELVREGVATAQAMEQARFEVQTTQAQIASARAAVEIAEHQLAQARAVVEEVDPPSAEAPGARIPITAPVDGAVLLILQESAGPVQIGAPILELGDPSNLEIVVDVLTTQAVGIDPGARAIVEQWGAGEVIDARVRGVEPAAFTRISSLGVEEQRVNVILDVVEPTQTWAALGDGFRVEARIITAHEDDILKVDASAVFWRDDGWVLFRLVEGRAELTPVIIGARTDREVQVLEGIEEGDEVVLYPGDAIEDGVRVEPRS